MTRVNTTLVIEAQRLGKDWNFLWLERIENFGWGQSKSCSLFDSRYFVCFHPYWSSAEIHSLIKTFDARTSWLTLIKMNLDAFRRISF
jgi:hypothetical protein